MAPAPTDQLTVGPVTVPVLNGTVAAAVATRVWLSEQARNRRPSSGASASRPLCSLPLPRTSVVKVILASLRPIAWGSTEIDLRTKLRSSTLGSTLYIGSSTSTASVVGSKVGTAAGSGCIATNKSPLWYSIGWTSCSMRGPGLPSIRQSTPALQLIAQTGT